MGFTKLFSSITESSVWCESDKTLRIWVAMLARANAFGIVEGSIPGMASLCRMNIKDFQSGIKPLLDVDPFSRNPDFEGRRLQECAGGWLILNYKNYREKPQDKEGSAAERMRRYRAKRNALQPNVTGNTDADADAEADKRKKTVHQNKTDFDAFWQSYPKKIGKKAALKAWTKAKDKPPLESILKALEIQKKSDDWIKDFGQYIPHPATWLNQGRWADEVKEITWHDRVRSTN